MSAPIHAPLFAGTLFVGMVILLEIGRRIGLARLARDPESARAGVGVVDNAVFALLGLLIAFTFSGAADRFDARRKLIVEEANAIGTAYLRLDLLAPEAQAPLQELMRRYVDVRLELYRSINDPTAVQAALAQGAALQNEIWHQAVAGVQHGQRTGTILLLPALNQMIDVTTTRAVAAQTHPPMVIYVMLAILALISALFAGYEMAGGTTRNWIHVFGFALIVAGTVYIIIDLEHPRSGWIRIDAVDQVLADVRATMK